MIDLASTLAIMTDDLIVKPHESKRDKLKKLVGSFSPNVNAALIAAAMALLLAVMGMVGGCLKVNSDNKELRTENSTLKNKVHDLEQEVGPFRNLAVQEFRSADASSMKKLADLMTTLKNDYSNAAATVNSLRAEVEHLRTLVPKRRQLTVATAHDIIAKLKLTNFKNVEVFTQAEDIDTQELRNAIAGLFQDSAIKVSGGPVLGVFAYGVRVITKNANPALEDAMKPLFSSIGETPNFQTNAKLDETTVHVYVGAAFPRN